jgi:hypothetical protein
MATPKSQPFAIPTVGVEIGEQTLTLRGISLRDVSILLQKHGASLALLYSRYIQNNDQIVDQQVNNAVLDIAQTMPDLVAELISLTSRNVLSADEAGDLSLPDVVTVLTAIGEVTFRGEGAWEKFLGATLQMVESAATAFSRPLAPAKKTSPSGTPATATPFTGSFQPVR